MVQRGRTRILLTTPHLHSVSSPYPDLMALAKYLPKDEFDLTVCSVAESGYRKTAPILSDLGVRCFVAKFRPLGHSWRHFKYLPASIRDQKIIDKHGPFDIQHSLDFVSMPFEALAARWKARIYIYNQGNLHESGSKTTLRLKIRFAHRIIAVSEAVMKLLYHYGASPDKLRRIYLGVDLDEIDKQVATNQEARQNQLGASYLIRGMKTSLKPFTKYRPIGHNFTS